MRRIFSNNYYTCLQKEFIKALEEKDYPRALEVLKRVPGGENDSVEDSKRIIMLGEAYKALAEALLNTEKPTREQSALEQIAKNCARSNL